MFCADEFDISSHVIPCWISLPNDKLKTCCSGQEEADIASMNWKINIEEILMPDR